MPEVIWHGGGSTSRNGTSLAIPPTRAFLDQHIGESNFLDYVSRRSPVFKERPLPASKREAIALMLAQPNLIKRPILIVGTRAIFGFDKEAYERL